MKGLADCSIEEAYARLNAMTAAQRNRYGGVPKALKPHVPKGTELVDRIFTNLYGRTYRPPAPPKKITSRSPSPRSATPKTMPVSPDEAIRQLQAAATADEAWTILGKMKRSVAEHQGVADAFEVVYGKRPTIAMLTDGIVNMVLAARQFEPLQRGGMR